MSTTTTSGAGWTAGRVRRARVGAGMLIVIAVISAWSLTKPWFGFALKGPATCAQHSGGTVQMTFPGSSQAVSVRASGCITGYDSAHLPAHATNPAAAAFGPDMQQQFPLPTKLGLPATTTWLLIGCAVGAAGLLWRNALISAAALIPCYLSYTDLGSLKTSMLSGTAAELVHPMVGLSYMSDMLSIGVLTCISWAAFVARNNHQQRKLSPKAGAMRNAALDILAAALKLRDVGEKVGSDSGTH